MKILLILLALALVLLAPGMILCFIGLRRRNPRGGDASGPLSFRMEREWLKQLAPEDVFIQSRDGLKLRAHLIERGDNRRFVIACHGYRAHGASMSGFARHFQEKGWAVLLPDARAHGGSEGKWIGMGWPERFDILNWIAYLNQRFHSPEIVLFGISMGGATVMNAAGEDLPKNVRLIIEDCGYASLKKELLWQLKHFYHLPARPFLALSTPVCRLLAGYSPIRDGDTCAQLRKCRLPMLLIHGDKDNFVPPAMMDMAWAAIPGPKEKFIVPGAAHAESISANPEAYLARVDTFLEKYADS